MQPPWFENVRRLAPVVLVGLVMSACSVNPAPTDVATTTTSGTPIPRLALAASGLGEILLDTSPEAVIEGVSAVAGLPDRDSDWIDPDSIYGRCPGDAVRAVGWGSLLALFTRSGGEERFFTYSYGFDDELGLTGVDPYELDLTTEAGIGLGSTVAELRAAYGERLVERPDPDLDLWTFAIDPDAADHLTGQTTGPEPADTVVFIEHRPGCEDRNDSIGP